MTDLANVFKALCDETRLRIMSMLVLRGELCVCDVMGALGISQSKSSRHLRTLYNAGLVQNRREAAWVYYRVAESPGADQKNILNVIRGLIGQKRLDELQAQTAEWFALKEQSSACC